MSMVNKFCAQCGAPLSEGTKFCESCGNPVARNDRGAGAPTMPELSAFQSQPLSCSKCNRADQVVLASQYNPDGDTVAATEKIADDDRIDADMVCDFLAKPEKPTPDGLRFWLILPFIPLLNFLLCWFAPMYRGCKFFMLGIVIVFWVCVAVPDLYAMGAYAFVGIFFVLFYYFAIFIARGSRQAEYLTKKIPEYNKMAAQWEHLRYCKRCQVVWLESNPSHTMNVVEVEDLLKS